MLGNTCDSFAQGMILAMKNNDRSFRGMLSDCPWNEIELFGTFAKVDLNSFSEHAALSAYLVKLETAMDNLSKLMDNKTKENFDFNFDFLKSKDNNLLSKFVLNTLVGKTLFPEIIKLALLETDKNPYIYMTSFQNGQFDVYKITLSTPYLQSIYSICPGILYEKTNPYSSFPTNNYM
jgi:hypothetical protein